jgi:hypothetical protein
VSTSWEWRLFLALEGEPPLAVRARELATQLGKPAHAMEDEEDLYWVVAALPHNLKVRGGQVELKRWVQTLEDEGLSCWEDKRRWSWPLSSLAAEELGFLLGDTKDLGREVVSTDDFLEWTQERFGATSIVAVSKRRMRIDCGDSRLEIADVRVGGITLRSFCVDGYDLAAVRSLIGAAKLREQGHVLSYPELLRSSPQLQRETDIGAHG